MFYYCPLRLSSRPRGVNNISKTIRWYYKKNEFGCIKYLDTGNKVPKTDGAWPFMSMFEFQKDVDYQWYFKKSLTMLRNIGYYGIRETQLELF